MPVVIEGEVAPKGENGMGMGMGKGMGKGRRQEEVAKGDKGKGKVKADDADENGVEDIPLIMWRQRKKRSGRVQEDEEEERW